MDIYWEQWKENDLFVDEDLSYTGFVLYFSFSNIQQIPWNWKKFWGLFWVSYLRHIILACD